VAQPNSYLRVGQDKCGLDNDFLRQLLTSTAVPSKGVIQMFKGVCREKEPGSGESGGVLARLGLGLGVRSLAPALRHGITRGVL